MVHITTILVHTCLLVEEGNLAATADNTEKPKWASHMPRAISIIMLAQSIH